jgi:hypothetical protein
MTGIPKGFTARRERPEERFETYIIKVLFSWLISGFLWEEEAVSE